MPTIEDILNVLPAEKSGIGKNFTLDISSGAGITKFCLMSGVFTLNVRSVIWKHGNQWEYGKKMLEIYGKEVVNELEKLDKQNKQFTADELQGLIKKYKAEVERIS